MAQAPPPNNGELIAEEPPSSANSGGSAEVEFFRESGNNDPGIYLPLTPKRGYLRIDDPGGTTSVTVFSFIVLIGVLVFLVLVGAFVTERTWISEIAKIVGQALLAVVGAIVGSSAASKKRK